MPAACPGPYIFGPAARRIVLIELAVTRRALVVAAARACAGALVAAATGNFASATSRFTGPHPDPRPGVDGSRILPADQVAAHPDAVAAFDEARAIPEVLDGIRCQCGCADLPGMRSLLSCYEAHGMALDCEICQGEARLAYRLHGKGRTLAQIREAIDARYGG